MATLNYFFALDSQTMSKMGKVHDAVANVISQWRNDDDKVKFLQSSFKVKSSWKSAVSSFSILISASLLDTVIHFAQYDTSSKCVSIIKNDHVPVDSLSDLSKLFEHLGISKIYASNGNIFDDVEAAFKDALQVKTVFGTGHLSSEQSVLESETMIMRRALSLSKSSKSLIRVFVSSSVMAYDMAKVLWSSLSFIQQDNVLSSQSTQTYLLQHVLKSYRELFCKTFPNVVPVLYLPSVNDLSSLLISLDDSNSVIEIWDESFSKIKGQTLLHDLIDNSFQSKSSKLRRLSVSDDIHLANRVLVSLPLKPKDSSLEVHYFDIIAPDVEEFKANAITD